MGSSDLHVHVSKFNLIQTGANNYWVGVGEGGGGGDICDVAGGGNSQ